MQVSASARVRGKEACDTLAEHMKSFSEELHSSAACVGVDGKIKLPKRKKILTPTRVRQVGGGPIQKAGTSMTSDVLSPVLHVRARLDEIC